MTLNVKSHEREILSAFDDVVRCPNSENWIILDYEGNSNVLKVGDNGDGGIDELSTSFNSGKLQYGIAAVRCTAASQPKMILIQWQGEGVSSARLAATTAHANDLKRFLRGIHVVIIARSEDDVEPESILKAVAKLPTMNDVRRIEDVEPLPQAPVGSVYTPIKPNRDIDLSERDRFWKAVEQEESSRKVEERKRASEKAAQADRDKVELSRQIHAKLNIVDGGDGGVAKQGNKISAPKSNGDHAAGDSLIQGRRALFEQKANEQTEQIQRNHPPTRNTHPISPKMTSPVPNFGQISPKMTSPIPTFGQISPKMTSPIPKSGQISPMAQRQVDSGCEMREKREDERPKFDSSLETVSAGGRRSEMEAESTGAMYGQKAESAVGAQNPSISRDSGSVNPRSVNPDSVNPGSVNPGSVNPRSVNPRSVNPQSPTSEMASKTMESNAESVPGKDEHHNEREENNKRETETVNRTPQSYYEEPPAEDLKAVALWDYQAADDTEITFDPDDVITEIDQIDEGWWRGRGPDGRVGLFPANYVALL